MTSNPINSELIFEYNLSQDSSHGETQEVILFGRKFSKLDKSDSQFVDLIHTISAEALDKKDIKSLLSFAKILAEKDPIQLLANIDKFLISLAREDVPEFARLLGDVSPSALTENIGKFLAEDLGGMNPFTLTHIISEKASEKAFLANLHKFLEVPQNREFNFNTALSVIKNAQAIVKDGLDKKRMIEFVRYVGKIDLNALDENIYGLSKANLGNDFMLEMIKFIANEDIGLLSRSTYKVLRAGLDQEFVVEFARIIAEKDKYILADKIHLFLKAGLDLDKKTIADFPDRDLAHFAILMSQFDRNTFELIRLAAPLIKHEKNKNAKLSILKALDRFPVEERAGIVRSVLLIPADKKISHRLASYYPEMIKIEFLEIASLLPKGIREEIFTQFSRINGPELSFSQLFELISTHQELETILSSMQERLGSFTDAADAFHFSQRISDICTQLHLSKEHPLFQTLIEVNTIANPSVIEKPKNPFRLFKELQLLSEEKSSLSPSRFPGFDGQFLAYQLEPFTKQFAARVYLATDLPQGIGPDTLKELFASLRKRMAKMSPMGKMRIELSIKEMTSTTLSLLEKNFVADGFLNSLLKTDQAITSHAFYFFHILTAILEKSDVVLPGQQLSEREELLLKASSSIQFCSGGKKEGIALFYNLLNLELREQAEIESESVALDLIKKMVQKEVLNLISSESSFMKKVTKSANVAQLSHQSIFVKNLLVGHAPLDQTIEFDKHTGTLADSLIPQLNSGDQASDRIEHFKQKRDEVLAMLHRHLPQPKDVVQAFKNSMNERMKMEKERGVEKGRISTYQAMVRLLTMRSTSLKTAEIWEIEDLGDEDTLDYVELLTDRGAQEILIRAGLFSN